jgi:hypothetical protein
VGVVAAETVDDRFRLQGKVLVSLVAVGMAIATITLVLDGATGTRKTDTSHGAPGQDLADRRGRR